MCCELSICNAVWHHLCVAAVKEFFSFVGFIVVFVVFSSFKSFILLQSDTQDLPDALPVSPLILMLWVCKQILVWENAIINGKNVKLLEVLYWYYCFRKKIYYIFSGFYVGHLKYFFSAVVKGICKFFVLFFPIYCLKWILANLIQQTNSHKTLASSLWSNLVMCMATQVMEKCGLLSMFSV